MEPPDVWAGLRMGLLYEAGGGSYRRRPFGEVEKNAGVFASLMVQLPSLFSGGEVAFRHGGVEEVYDCGVADGCCEYGAHFWCSYADVECEVKPVVDGYRLVLEYAVTWVGKGAVPSRDRDATPDVVKALKGYVERFRGPWKLQFGLHNYPAGRWRRPAVGTSCSDSDSCCEAEETSGSPSLYEVGLKGMEGEDKEKIAGLLSAAKVGMFGDVKMAFVELKRTCTRSGIEPNNESVAQLGEDLEILHHRTDGRLVDCRIGREKVVAVRAYDENGNPLALPPLAFLDWSSVPGIELPYTNHRASAKKEFSFLLTHVEDYENVYRVEPGHQPKSQSLTFSSMAVAM